MLTMNVLFTVCILLTVSVYCRLVDVVVIILLTVSVCCLLVDVDVIIFILIVTKCKEMENG